MRVKIRNLGVIKEAEIDLKPLTIFIGPNNAGKTWLAYTLAGIFGTYGFVQYIKTYEEEFLRVYKPLGTAAEQVLNSGNATIDLVEFAKEYGERYFNNVARLAQSWMPEFMSTQLTSFEQLDISIDLAETKTDLLEAILNSSFRSEIFVGRQRPMFSMRKRRGEKKLHIFTSVYTSSEDSSTEEQEVEQLPSEVIKELLVRDVLQTLHRSLYPHVRILPTERTTFITFPSGKRKVEGGELTIQKQLSQEQKMKTMIAPVSSFLSMINATLEDELEEKEQRERNAKSNSKIREYIQLAQLLEKQILSGQVSFSPQELAVSESILQPQVNPAREIFFQPTRDSKLEISIASSMVKELSPLVLYLRYLARPGELLVIDEPEMNLHPEAQVKMIEFLAMLINAGLKVLVTTHSPYIVDHLANLIKAAEVTDKESIREEFYLKRTDAFLSKNKVSVYLVDRGHAMEVMDEDGVIQWNTFGEVSDRISEIYFKL